ncbi:MAG: hypothetical protein A3F83_16400 [Candidatus Glassbacteria bacterium RIFCSPLOWO2_12_FULL_58_11]|uniref:DUF4330 domain-containing protein n=1 Tax=Candidatus Glassbacteria bacterium RIFCSPLOWO2_12_FULL_58_11 TaxID=1817867 RepID=A0A1F5YLY5_9BACT|nr:MAG: hypothetical protein A3F83_16400 [Candidatus Glassbacteria bacterium RIFCSPLOWO2_12_FULL_58_11]
MNIIDEKGRLFGLINLLDLIVLLGALIVLYLGISVFLVLKAPALKLVGFSPDRIEEGTSVPATAELINNRSIVSASLRLIPHSFPGETVQLTCQSSVINNKQLTFSYPQNLKPGEYEVELEIAVKDIFSRTSIHIDRLAGKFLTVEPKKIEVVEIPVEVKPVFDSKCLWEVGLSVVIPGDQLVGNNPPNAGENFSLSFPDLKAVLAGIRESTPAEFRALPSGLRRAGARTVDLTITGEFPALDLYLKNSATQLTLYRPEGNLTGYILNRAFAVLDLILYIERNSQLAALQKAALEKAAGNNGRPEMIALFGEIDNPWLKASEGRSSLKIQQTYQIARLKLACSVENGKLQYNNQPLEPNRLAEFRFGVESIEGAVLANSPDYVNLTHYMLLTNFPRRLVPLLKPGIVIVHPSSGETLGYVLKVLDCGAIDPQSLMRPDAPTELGELFCRAMVQLALNCTYGNGLFSFNGATVDYGANLNFRMLGENLSGIVSYSGTLPPQGRPVWQEVKVEFRNISPEVAGLISAGDSETVINGPVTKRIKSIESNDSARAVVPNAEGLYRLGRHPLNRDVRCRMELYVSKSGDFYYYNNTPLYLGMSIPFSCKGTGINGILVDFQSR